VLIDQRYSRALLFASGREQHGTERIAGEGMTAMDPPEHSSGFVPLARVTREEVCLGGVTIPAGDTVLPAFNIANRDPAAFDDPDRLDVGRSPRTHLGFGAGAHHCIGAQLARMELQEAFRGLLTRLPGLRLAVPTSDLELREGQAITSLRELPVTWDDA
jgi:cytochrome P450